MWTINEILHNDNFNNFSKTELLEVIHILRNDLKYYKYRKDAGNEQLVTLINSLKAQIDFEKKETARLKQVNLNYHNKIVRPLTFWERIKGHLDLKN